MANLAIIGETLRVTVTFRDWSTVDGQGAPVDPDVVTGKVLDQNLATVLTFSPVRLDVGVYQYDWTPNTAGTFFVEFDGTFPDSSVDVAREEFSVGLIDGQTSTTSLNEDQFLVFSGDMSPMYIDPEDIQSIYPDAPLVDIAEFVMVASEQVDAVRNEHQGIIPDINFNDLDYIRAAALCSLQRIYDINSGQGGVLTLGDLSIDNANFYKPRLNRAQAATWCELASVLWSEVLQRNNWTFTKPVGPFRGQGNDNPDPILPRSPFRPYR